MNLSHIPQVVSSLLKFVYNACVIVIGARVFGFSNITATPPSITITIPQRPKSSEKVTSLKESQFSIHHEQGIAKAHPPQVRAATTLSSKRKPQRFGQYITPKHLYFSNDTQQLEVARKVPTAIPVFNLHETLPRHVLRDHFDEVELPDADLYNFNEVSLAKYLPPTSPLLSLGPSNPPKAFDAVDIQTALDSLPTTEDGILSYIQEKDPGELPTAVLKVLSEKMRDRRQRVYERDTQEINNKFNKKVYKLK